MIIEEISKSTLRPTLSTKKDAIRVTNDCRPAKMMIQQVSGVPPAFDRMKVALKPQI